MDSLRDTQSSEEAEVMFYPNTGTRVDMDYISDYGQQQLDVEHISTRRIDITVALQASGFKAKGSALMFGDI